MNRLYLTAMLRRLVAIFALVTGLTALAAPAQAIVPLGKSSEISTAYGKASSSVADAECEPRESNKAPTRSKKSKGKAVKKRIIVIPPIHTGIDFAHE